ncbi:MAG: alpha/beta fold hydrolase [Granulosicoccus sp.]
MRPALESVTLNIDGIEIAGIRQRDSNVTDQPRMLCVHGWLDNANSFVPLMPYLPAFDLVAIDLPGTGYSAPLPGGYQFHELSYLLYQIIEALEWSDCHLTGHSLGGGLVPLLAVAHPPVVKTLTLIEAAGSLSEPASKLPGRMVKAFQDRQNATRFESRRFNDKQSAIDTRLNAAKMHPASARLIIDRQLVQSQGQYQWRFDKRWRYASPQYQTEEQVQEVLKAVQCPTLAVLADDGYLLGRDHTDARLACIEHLESITLPGNHHLHMDTPEPVAAAINRFLQTTPALGG